MSGDWLCTEEITAQVFGVEAVLAAGVADVGDRVAHDLLVVDDGAGGDFTGDKGDTGRHERFTRHATDWILGKNRIEDGIRNLVGDLVGMPLGHRLRRKQVPSFTAHAATLLPQAGAAGCDLMLATKTHGGQTSQCNAQN